MENKVKFICAMLILLICTNLQAQQDSTVGKQVSGTINLWLNSTGLQNAKNFGLQKIENGGLYRVEFGSYKTWTGAKGTECEVKGTSLQMNLVPVKFEARGVAIAPIIHNITIAPPAPRPLTLNYTIHRDTVFKLDTSILQGLFLNPYVEQKVLIETGKFNPFNGRFDLPIYFGIQNNPLKRYLLSIGLGYRGKGQTNFGAGTAKDDCNCERSDIWTLRLQAGYKYRVTKKTFISLTVQSETVLNKARIPLDLKREMPYWRPYGSTLTEIAIGHDFMLKDKKLGTTNLEVKGGFAIDGGNLSKAKGQGGSFFVSIRATPVWKAQMKKHKDEPDKFAKWINRSTKSLVKKTWSGMKWTGKKVYEGSKKTWNKSKKLFTKKQKTPPVEKQGDNK